MRTWSQDPRSRSRTRAACRCGRLCVVHTEVVIAGAGPAGLAVAAACAAAGLRTVLVAPAVRPWPQTYGLWADQLADVLPALGLDPARAADIAIDTLVRTAASGQHYLGRGYARLRNDVIHRALLDRFTAHGGEVRPGRVIGLDECRVVLADGDTVTGVVLDARGSSGPGTAQQRAWGEIVDATAAADLVPSSTALLMDWTALPGDPPAFLYGLPMDDGRTLLEATSLAARPPEPLPALRARLHRLLTERGMVPLADAERVAIPLDAMPRRGSAVPVGAAAGLVHPATGYSVAASLRLGPQVAAALAAGGGPVAARQAVRSARNRVTAGLLQVGLEALLPLNAAETDRFFAAFFGLPPGNWAAYLDVGSAPGDVAAAMTRVFRGLPPATRVHLARTAIRQAGPAGIRAARGRKRAASGPRRAG